MQQTTNARAHRIAARVLVVAISSWSAAGDASSCAEDLRKHGIPEGMISSLCAPDTEAGKTTEDLSAGGDIHPSYEGRWVVELVHCPADPNVYNSLQWPSSQFSWDEWDAWENELFGSSSLADPGATSRVQERNRAEQLVPVCLQFLNTDYKSRCRQISSGPRWGSFPYFDPSGTDSLPYVQRFQWKIDTQEDLKILFLAPSFTWSNPWQQASWRKLEIRDSSGKGPALNFKVVWDPFTTSWAGEQAYGSGYGQYGYPAPAGESMDIQGDAITEYHLLVDSPDEGHGHWSSVTKYLSAQLGRTQYCDQGVIRLYKFSE
jgi:hypothetical protein